MNVKAFQSHLRWVQCVYLQNPWKGCNKNKLMSFNVEYDYDDWESPRELATKIRDKRSRLHQSLRNVISRSIVWWWNWFFFGPCKYAICLSGFSTWTGICNLAPRTPKPLCLRQLIARLQVCDWEVWKPCHEWKGEEGSPLFAAHILDRDQCRRR